MSDREIIDDLVTANHILYNEGVVDGFGPISVRHPTRPDRFLLSRSIAPATVNAEDIYKPLPINPPMMAPKAVATPCPLPRPDWLPITLPITPPITAPPTAPPTFGPETGPG